MNVGVAERRWRQVIEHIPAVTYIDIVVAPGDVAWSSSARRSSDPRLRARAVPRRPRVLVLADPPRRPGAARGVGRARGRRRLDRSMRSTGCGRRTASYRWIHDTSTPVLRDDGQLDHFLGFMIDITERMQAQEARASGRGALPPARGANPGDHLHRVDRRALRADVGQQLPEPADRGGPRVPHRRTGSHRGSGSR